MRKTKIVCTIGPTSQSKAVFTELVKNGLNVARLNFSHGNHEEHFERIKMIKEVREELGIPVAILLDTKGPEIRTRDFKDGLAELKEGQDFVLTTENIKGDNNKCSITYDNLPKDVKKGDKILIDDGLIELEVTDIVDNKNIKCRVNNGGIVKDKKGINVPGVKINLPAITEKDISDIEFGIENRIDFIAASFIRKAEDVHAIRRVLEENNAYHIQIISKIENQEGLDNIDEIIEVSDGIMVARGDLGVEIPTEMVPIAQKEMIGKCNKVGKPVITATQMLDSMMRNPRPTRAEVTDVANAIFDGTDAIMLSGETAAGKYPIEAVRTMANIAKRTEDSLDYEEILHKRMSDKETSVTYAVSHATCNTAHDLGASAIISATSSGFTARMVSKFRPKAPIIAATTRSEILRRLVLVWGVKPVLIKDVDSTDEIFELSINKAKEYGYIKNGDLVVITAGVPVGISGATNLIKVHIVGEILIKGMGVGKNAAAGKVCNVRTISELEEKFQEGDVLVTIATDKDMVKYMDKASAIIVEEGGLSSHAAIVGLSLGKPVIVGAENATKLLTDKQMITVDSIRGLVYSGKARVL
ncbi:pyruvate kinase [Maledivibacter halophilus]|uniref:Pyruvate kinase n=1 Tax=Maledivibacter halophilus TaxID=36842 RepID=A0A1T5MY97_9FIRM|nr:pyruvate kinase [Maledivibacter halophilus]SKC92808.1 pyruvate kinase [Maledivibacter halophilus]